MTKLSLDKILWIIKEFMNQIYNSFTCHIIRNIFCLAALVNFSLNLIKDMFGYVELNKCVIT